MTVLLDRAILDLARAGAPTGLPLLPRGGDR